jgi:hypothetical protein
VPTVVWGRNASLTAANITSLVDIVPSIVKLLQSDYK